MRIRFWTSSSGRSPVEDWLHALPIEDRAKVAAVLVEIEEVGWQAAGCEFRQIKSKLWEIKIHAPRGGFRLFYVIVTGPEMILLHALRKATRKTPKKDVDLALQRMEDL